MNKPTAEHTLTNLPSKLLYNRNFMLLWGGLMLSQIGDVIRAVALPATIYNETDSSMTVAGIMMAGAIPSLFLAPVTGFLIDRVPRRYLLIGSNIVRGICSLLIPVAIEQGMAWMYVLALVSAVMAQFYMPVVNVVLPDIINREDLVRANSFTGLSYRLTQILGGAITGILLTTIDSKWIFWIDGLSFWVFAVFTVLVQLPTVVHATQSSNVIKSFVADTKKSFAFLAQNTFIVFVILVFVIDTIGGATISTVLPAYALDQLLADERGLGLLYSIRGVGALIGMVSLSFLGSVVTTTRVMVMSLTGVGILLVLLAANRSFELACLFLLLEGLIASGYTIAARSLQQEHIATDMRGKVVMLGRTMSGVSYMLAAGLAGILASWGDVSVALAFAGTVFIIFSVSYLRFAKQSSKAVLE